MNRLVIRLHTDGAAQWMLGARRGEGLPATPLAGAADEVVLIVPSEPVLLLSAPRISPRREELERGLAFAIEERLAAPVEQLQVAAGEWRGDAGSVPALVVERGLLESWLQRLEATGLAPDRVLPDAVLVPWDGRPTLWVEGERFILRFDRAGAYAGLMDELGPVLARCTAGPHVVMRCADASLPPALADAEVELVPDALTRLVAGLDAARGFDLLAGDYAERRRRHGQGRRLWAWVAALLVAAIGLGLIHGLVELGSLKRHNLELQARMDNLYRELVPQATRVVDAEAQLADAVARMRGQGGGALSLLARAAPALGEGRYALDLIEVREDGMELVVRGPDLAALDALRQALARQLGRPVELASAVPGQGEVEGRLRARGGAE